MPSLIDKPLAESFDVYERSILGSNLTDLVLGPIYSMCNVNIYSLIKQLPKGR